MQQTKTTRSLEVAACSGLLLTLVLSLSTIAPARAETLGTWNSTTPWKNSDLSGIAGESCVTYDGYVYCVGGYIGEGVAQDEVEYAQISSLISSPGSDNWVSATSYPTGFNEGSCAVDSSIGYIYCVGGAVSSSGFTFAVYYAELSASGGLVGGWTSTTAYPTVADSDGIALESCAIDSSLNYIYCIGGTADTSFPETPDNAEEWAPVSASGVGAWSGGDFVTLIDGQSCSVASGYIYCVGGFVCPEGCESLTQPVPSDSVYYSATSTDGLEWAGINNYPIDIGSGSCGISSGYIYCVGGETSLGGVFTNDVEYATANSTGIGAWTSTTAYPGQAEGTELLSCVVPGGDILCVGGLGATGDMYLPEVITGAVNYAAIGGYASSSSTSASSSSSSSSSSTASTATTSTSTTSTSTGPAVPVCPNTQDGVLMPPGATFTDGDGNVWVAPSGYDGGGGFWSSYFFQGSYLVAPPPMLDGWGGVYGIYNGEQGWIITFYCA
ncbi:MAG: hypothetical protein OK441_04280 [Thaumarchaeota archaeon]|nr:hypothetical protein [Nitrososphaerota archaeon]